MKMAANQANPTRARVLHIPVAAALAPVHKLALGVAVGTVCGVGVFALTVFHLVFQPTDALDIRLLAQYFYRYDVTWLGAVIGLFWGFVSGFVAGWFVAFVRNLVVAVRVLVLRGKAELAQFRDILDQI
jgi:hypothetical protein